MPTISIIIVNYQNWELLSRCLDSIKAIQIAEVIVVDNCSPTRRLAEFSQSYPYVKFIENTGNNGFANACNVGAEKAKGTYLLFLNPDTIANEGLINGLLDNYQNVKNIGILGIVQKNSNGKKQAFEKPYPTFTTILGWSRAIVAKVKFSKKIFLANNVQAVPWVSGAAVFISKEWLNRIGGWDERFWMYFEDIAICKAVCKQGGKIGILTAPVLLHAHGGSSRINSDTTALTKLEVMISRHVYISNYLSGLEKNATQCLAVFNHLIICFVQAAVGLFISFKPKGMAYLKQFKNLILYYNDVLQYKSWISKRSVASLKSQQ